MLLRGKSYAVTHISIDGNTISIFTLDTVLKVVLKYVLTKNKTKTVLDKFTTGIAENKLDFDLEELLKGMNICYYDIVAVDDIKDNDTNVIINIENNTTLLGRYEDKILQVEQVSLTDKLLSVTYKGGVLIHYLGLNLNDSKYATTYTDGILTTIQDLITRIVIECKDKKKTLLFSKLFNELELLLPLSLILIYDNKQ